MREYLKNGNHFGQSNFQLIELHKSVNTERVISNSNVSKVAMPYGCLFWVFDPFKMRNLVFFTDRGCLAHFSYDGRVIVVWDEKNFKLCFWYYFIIFILHLYYI